MSYLRKQKSAWRSHAPKNAWLRVVATQSLSDALQRAYEKGAYVFTIANTYPVVNHYAIVWHVYSITTISFCKGYVKNL